MPPVNAYVRAVQVYFSFDPLFASDAFIIYVSYPETPANLMALVNKLDSATPAVMT